MFEMRRLRINQKAGRDRESGPLGFIGQAGDAERPADPHRPSENASCEFGQAVELAGATGEHYAGARLGRERRSLRAGRAPFPGFLPPAA